MKTLANCTLKEFLMQSNKIRHAASTFSKSINLTEIRKTLPEFTGNETDEEKTALIKAQSKENISKILDRCLEENVDETIRIVGLMCFKTPEEAEIMEATEFLDVVLDLLCSERVINFFTKLMNSGLIDMVKS